MFLLQSDWATNAWIESILAKSHLPFGSGFSLRHLATRIQRLGASTARQEGLGSGVGRQGMEAVIRGLV